MRPPARTGNRPRGWRLAAALTCWAALPALGANLVIHVQSPEGTALAGVVVTARALDAPARRAAPVHAVIDQVQRAFVPDLLIVPVGSTVEFPNSDTVNHQIYSFSAPKRFQLPLYRGKPYPPVLFEQSGVVTLGCNIHDEMLAYLVITDASFFGRTDASGAWSAEVARGRYRIAVWHPRLREDAGELERELTVGDGDRAELTLRVQKPLQPAPLGARPHSWDY